MDRRWLALAIEALEQNDLESARALLRAYVQRYPHDKAGRHWLSRVVNMSARQHKPAPRRWPRFLNTAIYGLSALLFLVLLGAVAPMFMGNRTLIILSGSMEPNIATGSVAVAEPVLSHSLTLGDIIAYAPSPTTPVPIVHRIIAIREKDGVRYYTTRGDANDHADGEVSLPPTAWRVRYSMPVVGYVISYATTPLGNLLLTIVPLLSLGAMKLAAWRKVNPTAWPTRRKHTSQI